MTTPQIIIISFMFLTIILVYCQYETKFKLFSWIKGLFIKKSNNKKPFKAKPFGGPKLPPQISDKNGRLIANFVIGVGIMFGIIYNVCVYYSTHYNTNTPIKEIFEVSTDNRPSYSKDEHTDISTTWDKNPIACKNEYSGRSIYISGTIENISDPMFKLSDNHNVAFIYVKCSTCGQTVCANIKRSSEYASLIDNLTVGGTATFVGTFYDIMWGNVRIDCK